MICNGIDTAELAGFVELVHTTPEAGALSVAVQTAWRHGYTMDAATTEIVVGGERIPRDHRFTVDLPHGLGGADHGAAPGELLLTALCACVAQSFVEAAAVGGVDIHALAVTGRADLDLRGAAGVDGVRPGLRSIHLALEVDGALSDEDAEQLLATAVRTSPIADTLTARVPIGTSVRQPSPSR